MCPYDEARLPLILKTLDEVGVISDLVKMTLDYDKCLPTREHANRVRKKKNKNKYFGSDAHKEK